MLRNQNYPNFARRHSGSVAIILCSLLGMWIFGTWCSISDIAAEESGEAAEFQRISFKNFFADQINPVDLSLEIPSQYVRADQIDAPVTYAYWMEQKEILAAIETQDLPKKTGYLYGKVSENEGYDPREGKFFSEEVLESTLAENGAELLDQKRFDVDGYPVWAYAAKMSNDVFVFAIYVGMKIETNALYFSYTAPVNDLPEGLRVWKHIVGSIRPPANRAPAGPQ